MENKLHAWRSLMKFTQVKSLQEKLKNLLKWAETHLKIAQDYVQVMMLMKFYDTNTARKTSTATKEIVVFISMRSKTCQRTLLSTKTK